MPKNNFCINEFDIIEKNVGPILEILDSKTRGKMGEYLCGLELLKNNWEVYQPIEDTYVDFIIKHKNKNDFKTIQVKASKFIEEKAFKVNHDPKDMLHDSRHFFIWFFYNQLENDHSKRGSFVIIKPEKFCKYVMNGKRNGITASTWRKNASRESIYKDDLESKKWFKNDVNNWKKLLTNKKSNLVGIQEEKKKWKNGKNFAKKWKSNLKLLKKLLSDSKLGGNTEIIDGKTRVRKRILGEIDTPEFNSKITRLCRPKSKKYLNRGITYAYQKSLGSNIFQNVENFDSLIKLKIVCANCNELWEADEKECYDCKIWRPPVKICGYCKTINKLESRNCRECRQSLKAICVGCSKEIKSENTIPLTSCIICGHRRNKFIIEKL